MFGKISNGRVIYCPRNGKLKDGTFVFNLAELIKDDDNIRESEGWYPVEREVVDFNPNTQRIVFREPYLRDGVIFVPAEVVDYKIK